MDSKDYLKNVKVIKKDGNLQNYDFNKIIVAINKSATRVNYKFSKFEIGEIQSIIESILTDYLIENDVTTIPIMVMHSTVEKALTKVVPEVANSYKEYRNYKVDFIQMLDKAYTEAQKIQFHGDKENSNSDSTLVSTKRCLTFGVFNKELYKKFFLTKEEIQAIKDGYIYIHDMSSRRDTMNCCIFDIEEVLRGGFEHGNLWYNEPKRISSLAGVIGDIVLSAASQQYGGFTVPSVDEVIAPYVEKNFLEYMDEYIDIIKTTGEVNGDSMPETLAILAKYHSMLEEEHPKEFDMGKELLKDTDSRIITLAQEYALKKVSKDLEQLFQELEYKFNSLSSSRGDYPFIAFTLGHGKKQFEQLTSIMCLDVRRKGQGKKGKKRPVLFPKLIFLYDEELHGEGKPLEQVFQASIDCSSKTMYPDYLSLTSEDPDNHVCQIYKKYGKIIHPMGCRAFLSPWYERGGIAPADENDVPIFKGRFNIGVVSLHLPMILAKSRRENLDFYEVLDYYLDMIHKLHRRTYDYLAEKRASINPLAYCEGGFYGGHLKPNDKIEPVLRSSTASFGITALNELQKLYNQKSLVQDGNFALEVMDHISKKVKEYTKEDGYLYAIYGTPAENLCGVQVKQFRTQFGIVKNVSDREYVSNSFHCHVSENISPIQKQDLEYRFWKYFWGGRIQYVKYPIAYNRDAIVTLVRRAMKMGLYEGVNLSLSYCNNCGHEQLDMDVCPICGSTDIIKIERMNGYLSYSRVHGDTRLNAAKMAEIKDRVSM